MSECSTCTKTRTRQTKGRNGSWVVRYAIAGLAVIFTSFLVVKVNGLIERARI